MNQPALKSNKYLLLQDELAKAGTGKMKCYGTSMLPILKSGSLLTFKREETYRVGDIVFCKVKGRFIDAHKITKIKSEGGVPNYLIANNRGWENGWTKAVFGRVVKAEQGTETKTFDR